MAQDRVAEINHMSDEAVLAEFGGPDLEHAIAAIGRRLLITEAALDAVSKITNDLPHQLR